jgi:hypothetical protein
LGAGENGPKFLKDFYNHYGGDLTKNYGIFGLEALYEWDLNNETNKIGAKVGLDIYGESEWKAGGYKITQDTYAFPVTVYYKKDNGVKAWSYYGGAGVTFLKNHFEIKFFGESKEDKWKVFPHIMAGGEYRFTELFALGLEAKYNCSAKVRSGSRIMSDRSGLSGSIVGRFYF